MSHRRRYLSLFASVRGTFRGFQRISLDDELEPQFPRLIERNLPYHQSRNEIQIRHRHARNPLYSLLKNNWFHVFLRLDTRISIFILLLLWTFLIVFFAVLYVILDNASPDVDCGLSDYGVQGIQFHGAFGFSLETATTVGYSLPGTSNALFENCIGVTTAIYFQMMTFMMFNAFVFAFFFARLARSESRAIQVIFSDKCVVRKTERGNIVFEVRVYDVETGHGIVEAHVRLYALLKHKDADGHPKMEQLRIVSPNDDLGAVLFLNIPTVVTHDVDYYSPLYVTDAQINECDKYRLSSGGLLLREVDSVTGNREEIMCPVCGETYGDFRRLRKHVRYNQLTEKKDDIPIKGSHQELNVEDIPRQSSRPTVEQIRNNLPLQELICVVEGIDPLTSGTFQALQSYMPEDLEWDARFVPCVTSTTALDATFVDLELFHRVKSTSMKDSHTTTTGIETFQEHEQTQLALRKARKYGVEQV